jgi:hypothetical protein
MLMYHTEIVYDRETREYAMYIDKELVGYARTYHEAELTLAQLVFELIHSGPFHGDPPEPGDNPDKNSNPTTEGPSPL